VYICICLLQAKIRPETGPNFQTVLKISIQEIARVQYDHKDLNL
jgi:hypothetical protein